MRHQGETTEFLGFSKQLLKPQHIQSEFQWCSHGFPKVFLTSRRSWLFPQCFNWHCSTEFLWIVLFTAHPLGRVLNCRIEKRKYNMKPLLMCQCKCTYVDMSVDMSFDFTFLLSFYSSNLCFTRKFTPMFVGSWNPPAGFCRSQAGSPHFRGKPGASRCHSWGKPKRLPGNKKRMGGCRQIVKWLRNSISFCSFWWYLISELVTNHFSTLKLSREKMDKELLPMVLQS